MVLKKKNNCFCVLMKLHKNLMAIECFNFFFQWSMYLCTLYYTFECSSLKFKIIIYFGTHHIYVGFIFRVLTFLFCVVEYFVNEKY